MENGKSENTNFDAEAKNEFADKFQLLAKALEALKIVSREKNLSEENKEALEAIPAFKKFFEVELGSQEELEMKKHFVSALIAAQEQGVAPISLPSTPEAVAILVDEGLTTAKVAYQVSTGALEEDEAFDVLYDRVVATISSVVHKVVAAGFPYAVKAAAKFIAQKFPQTKPVVDFAEKVLPPLSGKVADGITAGIKKIAKVTKPVVKTCIEKVKSVSKSVTVFGKKAWNKLTSIFA